MVARQTSINLVNSCSLTGELACGQYISATGKWLRGLISLSNIMTLTTAAFTEESNTFETTHFLKWSE